jgi:hypothetical protein
MEEYITIAAQGEGLKLTLLGTGCPPPAMHRFGPSTLVEARGGSSCEADVILMNAVSSSLISCRRIRLFLLQC